MVSVRRGWLRGRSKLLPIPAMAELLGRLMLGIFADLVLGARNLTEAVVILRL